MSTEFTPVTQEILEADIKNYLKKRELFFEPVNIEILIDHAGKSFSFHDLTTLDDLTIQSLIRNINNDTLLIALQGANGDVLEKFFFNMGRRSAQILVEDLPMMEGLDVEDIKEAQLSILGEFKKLEHE